jgi:hypothetical protein
MKSLEKRREAAKARAASALSLFRAAAAGLDEAVKEHRTIATEARRVADRHDAIAVDHSIAALDAESQANKIREFFGGSK